MQILKLIQSNQSRTIKQAVNILKNGGMIVYPTETCYGLGVDTTNQKAVDKLLSYKRRREGKPLSVLVDSQETAEKYVDLNDSAKNFYQNFLPGPITVISKAKQNLAGGVVSEIGTLGIRISSYPLTMDLAKAFGKPITATSANPSNKAKPYSTSDLLKNLSEVQKSKIDLILDAGTLPRRKSSTVVDTTLIDAMVLRCGDINIQTNNELISKSETETKNLAMTLCLQNLKNINKNGLVFALIGDLGAGKTIFAKGLGQFLKIKDEIISPSYVLVYEYDYCRFQTCGKFFHLDPWRLETFEQFLSLGFEQMLVKNNVICIEWASKYLEDIKKICEQKQVKLIPVYFSTLSESQRKIKF